MRTDQVCRPGKTCFAKRGIEENRNEVEKCSWTCF